MRLDAWTAAGGRATAGAGIKIGDIDSGIEETHPFFDPTGFSYPPGFPKCDAADSNSHHQDQDCKFVSPKVIVAKVFFNKAHQQGLDAQASRGARDSHRRDRRRRDWKDCRRQRRQHQ